MSLLLEALKKAERAKEEAQRRAREESGGGSAALRPESEAPTAQVRATEDKRVLTRDELPDISQPLEILSDDLPGKPPPAAAASPGAKEPQARAPEAAALAYEAPQPAQTDAHRTDAKAAERIAARKVFEAKFREPNPRLPFFVALGVLGVFAVGTVAYFWYQLRSPPPLAQTSPARPAGEVQAAMQAKPPFAPATPAQTQIPGLPRLETPPPSPAATARASPPAPPPKPAAAAMSRPVERPILPSPPRPAVPLQPAPRAASMADPGPELSIRRPGPQVHPRVESAYSAYVAGDLALARADYEQALREEPGNRDALLGLAAVDLRSGRYEAAEAGYQRLLQIDPRDMHAQAGLIALRGSRIDPVAAESRVKTMLAADPAAHVLNFTLGNQLAQQGRWAEAQQQYFKAFTADPQNADFAYNLAVSLDHLRQTRQALEYYQRAIALAKAHGASFDLEAAQDRVAKLGN